MSKITQAEANYRRGDPINHCGVCVFYQGHHRCSKVAGDISPFAITDVFKPDQNPFGATLTPREIQAIKNMAADAQDRSGEGEAAEGEPAAPSPPSQRPPQRMPMRGPPVPRRRPQPYFQ